MTVITEEFLALGRSTAGGWTKAQLALLEVPWPPVAGWKATIIGKSATDEAAAAFIAGRKQPAAT